MTDRRNWGELALFAGVAGAIASLFKSLVHQLFVWTTSARHLYFEINAFLIHGHTTVKSTMDWILSVLGDMVLGAILAFLLCLVLRRTRPRYHIWIGLAGGPVLWLFSLAFGNLVKILKPHETDHLSLLVLLVGMLVFSLLVVLSARIWPALRKRVSDTNE